MSYRIAAQQSFAALGDPTRRSIFERVAQRPMAVGELAAGLPVSRPAVSQHLKVLRESRLVKMVEGLKRRLEQLKAEGKIRSYGASLGPAIAGVLIATVGVEPCFVINAVTFLAMLVALRGMDSSELARPERAPRRPGALREGLAYVLRTPALAVPLAMYMILTGNMAWAFGLFVVAAAYGPEDDGWRRGLLAWTASFPHVARAALRGEPGPPEIGPLIGDAASREIEAARNRPLAVAVGIGDLLRAGRELGMDRAAFLQADEDLVALLDYVGGCERILKTPLPRSYAIQIRRFIVVFLATLPFALMPRMGVLTPLATMLVAYPLLALDKIGDDIQDPFSPRNLDFLPLDAIGRSIQDDLMDLASRGAGRTRAGFGTPT